MNPEASFSRSSGSAAGITPTTKKEPLETKLFLKFGTRVANGAHYEHFPLGDVLKKPECSVESKVKKKSPFPPIPQEP